MTLGEEIVAEMMKRNLQQDPISYEQMQQLKKLSSSKEISEYLISMRFSKSGDIDTSNDFVDFMVDPVNRKLSKFQRFSLSFSVIFLIMYAYLVVMGDLDFLNSSPVVLMVFFNLCLVLVRDKYPMKLFKKR